MTLIILITSLACMIIALGFAWLAGRFSERVPFFAEQAFVWAFALVIGGIAILYPWLACVETYP